MESNDKLFYDKLDLDPFTFSSPNSTGWNDVDLKNLLANTVQSPDIDNLQSSEQNNRLLELFVNESEVFAQIPQNELIQLESNNTMNTTTLEQKWKQPLPNPPLLQQDGIIESNYTIHHIAHQQRTGTLHEQYSKWLSYLHAQQNMNTKNIETNPNAKISTQPSDSSKQQNKQNKIRKKHSMISTNHSSKNKQKTPKTNLYPGLKQAAKSGSSRKTIHPANPSLLQIIQQMNKHTMQKLQNKR